MTMKDGISKWVLLAIALLVSAAVALAQEQSSSTGVKVNPSEVQKKVGSPPPATAAKTTSVGTAHVKMATPADSESWAEQIDADGNGQVDQATLTWDAKDRVLFSSTAGTFTCRNGTPGSGELLIAVNGTGNPRGRPAGSGFWLASLDKGQCGAQADALWGCKFDASGTATACGVAQLNEQNQDLVIVTADR
ncbi:MAG TPA: hypothetical protein VI488_15505 [Candidatus Angelobacter sp.]